MQQFLPNEVRPVETYAHGGTQLLCADYVVPVVYIGFEAHTNIVELFLNPELETVTIRFGNGNVLSVHVNNGNWRHNGSGTRSKSLGYFAACKSFCDFINADTSFFDRHTHIGCQRQNGVACYAFQNRRCKTRRHKLAVYYKEYVHHPHFVDVLVLFVIGPENLIKTLFASHLCRIKRATIISCTLGKPGSAFGSAHVCVFYFQPVWLGLISSHRTVHHDELKVICYFH